MRTTLAALATLTIVLAGCGGSTAKTSTGQALTSPGVTATPGTMSSGAGGAENAAACSLVTEAEAAKLFGHPAHQTTADNPSSAASSCIWKADTNPDANAVNDIGYLLQVRIYNGEQFYGEKYMTDAKHLDGIGDRAFTNIQGPLVQVQFVKHGNTVMIAYSIQAIMANPRPHASDQQDAVVALARAAAARA